MKPTKEQITNTNLIKEGKNVIITAGAGCGKSTSLRYAATEVPDKNFLILTFNKANAEETKNHPERPSNLFASTVHSLAYREVMNGILKPKGKVVNFLNYKDLPDDVILPVVYEAKVASDLEKVTAILFRSTIMESIGYFCRSASSSPEGTIEYFIRNKLVSERELEGMTTFSESIVFKLTAIAVDYWKKLIDPNVKIPVTPDIYLKVFQLNEYFIDSVWDDTSKQYVGIDILCLDEAQDTNPVTEQIFRNQVHLQKVIVGDANQQLYAWRGAGKTMSNFPDFEKGYLTESFRFNGTIADKANKVLQKIDSPLKLKGLSTKTSINSTALLCRMNVTVLAEVFGFINSNEGSIFTSIDLQGTFSKLYHIESCSYNKFPKFPHKELKEITNRTTLEEALSYSDEISRLYNLVILLKDKCGGVYKAKTMLENRLTSMKEANLVVSTVHGAKGLEWDKVILHEDLFSMDKEGDCSVEEKLQDETYNALLYVGITRARVEVTLPSYLQDVI